MNSKKLLLLLWALISGSWLLAGEKVLLNRIVIKLEVPAIQLPDPQGYNPLSQANIPDEALNSILQNTGALNVKRTIPSFNPADTLKTVHGHQVRLSNLALMFTVEFPDTNGISNVLSQIRKLPIISYAVPVYKGSSSIHSSRYPNDPEFQFVDSNGNGKYDPGETSGEQWGWYDFENEANPDNRADINLPEAWGYTTGSSDIVIGIFELWIGIVVDELSGRSAGTTGGVVEEHPTQVAGVAVANTDNDSLVAGVDWNAKFFSAAHMDETDQIASKFWDCVNFGCKIINNSWSGTGDDLGGAYLPFLNVVRNAYLSDVLITAGVGNDGIPTTDIYPAAWGDLVLSVAASGRINEHASYSNIGSYVDLTAPGGSRDGIPEHDMRLLTNSGGTTWSSGTSYAAPMVSGVASLMMSMRPDVRSEDVETILKSTATDIEEPEWDEETGWGKINAGKAVLRLTDSFALDRYTTTGGTITQLDNDWQTWYFAPSSALSMVKRYRIRKDISFDSFGEPPLIWGNIAGTQGAAPSNPNYEIPWCGVVNGTVTQTGATIETYVYWCQDPYDPYDPPFWYPCAPEDVEFAYTVLGLPENLTLENMSISTTEVYAATNSITAGPNFTVESSGDVTFQAGSVITLMPGFTAVAGSDFHAYIDEGLGLGKTMPPAIAVTTVVDEADAAAQGHESIPTVYSLSHAYPNPFNPNTTIRFGLPEAAPTRLVVYDILGREVRQLVEGTLEAGYHNVVWYGRDASGREVPSGLYIYRIVAGDFVKSRKMVILK